MHAARIERLNEYDPSFAASREQIQKWVDDKEVVGAEVHIIKNRRTVLHKSFGDKDKERHVPMVNDTIFCVRSMTKPVVGTAIQILIDEHKISLDDPAAKYLPSFDNDKSRAITIRHLLTHTSGLPLTLLDKMPKEYHSIREIADQAGEHGSDFEPGSEFQYSDEGADTLGAIVAQVSGMSLDEFVQKRILEPCGMRNAITTLKADNPKLVVVDLKPMHALARAVTLDQIKADRAFAAWDLVRIGRLSVVPVPKKNLPAYRRMAKKASKVWREHGALDYREWVADDVKMGKWTSFPRSVKLKPGETVEVSVDVENTGAMAADEVGQLYIHQQSGSASRPVRELRGFQRITLQPHAKTTLHMLLGKDELTYWSTAKKSWVTEPAIFDVWVGGNSEASLHTNFIVSQ
jgi:CubicO group peptidase (beta-lactamase class C family)